MNTFALNHTPARTDQQRPWGLAGLLITQSLLALAPIAVLGPAIGWPASLRLPAAQQLAAVAGAPAEVAAGYAVYLLYSLLIAPLMILLAARTFGSLAHPLAATVAAFAVMSTMARAIGILRWLTVMPVLAQTYATADATQRAQIELLFTAVTSYGGGIGELLGVSLLMAVAMAALGLGALKNGGLPRWLAAGAVVVAAALAALTLPVLLPTVALPFVMPIAVAGSLLSLWMLATGVHLLLRPGR